MSTTTEPHLKTYSADAADPTCITVWPQMVSELMGSRELIWRLLWRDIATRYRQSVLGYIWALVPPVATAVMFTFLSRTRVLAIGETSIPYPAYVLLGMVIWQFFAGGVTAAASSLIKGESLVTKISFPKETLVLASIGQELFELPIRLALVAIMFAWFGIVPAPTVVLAPLVLVPVLLLSLGIGFVVALANSLFRDLGESLPFVLLLAMFLTPVVYPPPSSWPWTLLNELNPLSVLVGAARELATQGYLSRPQAVTAASLFSLMTFLVGWRIFHLAESFIAERI